MRSVIAIISALLLAAGSATSMAADNKPDADAKAAEQRLQDAHRRLEQAAREVAELSAKASKDHMPDNFVFLGRNPNRAMLGIVIGASKETEVDDGAAVMSVSPGGPAAGAGIKAGDVIVELNGKSLKADKEDSSHEKLMSAMSKLSAGEEVTVRYMRDGKSSIAKMKAESLPQSMARKEVRVRVAPGERQKFKGDDFDFDFDFDMPRGFAGMMHGDTFGDMELVPLTPKLAQYFGTDKGLLIVRAPQGKDQKLEDGDVLVDIDGRVPTNPGHAFRILGSYQSGEKLTLNVLRQKKKTAVAMTVPEREDHEPRVKRKRIELVPGPKAPVPPVPPTPPV